MARIFDVILLVYKAYVYVCFWFPEQERKTRFPLSQFSCDPSESKEMGEGNRAGEEGKSFGLALGKLHQ